MTGRIADWILDEVMPALFALFCFVGMVGLCLFVLALMVDGAQALRSERATIACKAQQMDASRLTFTTDVICVPYATRRDTVAVEAVR